MNKRKINDFLDKPFNKWFIVPLLILLFSFAAFILYGSSTKSLLVQREHNASIYVRPSSDVIIKNEKVTGKFKASSNFLGIIALRFNTFNRISADNVIFRLREIHDKNWYYENTYKVDQFQNNELFPFGIPPISDSGNKEYVFEIESMNGKPGNAVALSLDEPTALMTYQLPVRQIFGSVELVKQTVSDSGNAIGIGRFLLDAILSRPDNFFIIFTPLLLYFFFILLRGRKYSSVLLNIVVFCNLVYIFLIGKFLPGDEIDSYPLIILLLVLTVIVVRLYKLSYLYYFVTAMLFLLLLVLVLIFMHRPDVSNRAAMFAFFNLVIGTSFALIQQNQHKTHKKIFPPITDIIGIHQLVLVSVFISRHSTRYNTYVNEIKKYFRT